MPPPTPVAPDDWPALAAFIHRNNRRADGGVRCLHSDQGDSLALHAAELARLDRAEACFVAAHGDDGTLQGVAGAEFDPKLGRAWTRGPLTADARDADLRAALLGALEAALPQVRRLDAFVSLPDEALQRTYRDAGYAEQQQHRVMERRRTADAPAWPAAVHAASPAEAAAVARLHERLFPTTYLDAETLRSTLDDDHRLFVAATGGGPTGYVYVQRRPDGEAYVDFIGVDEAARGAGHGRALLDAALHWAFVQRDVPQVSLTVRSDRAPALGLYAGAGFVEVAAGAHLVKERAPAVEPLPLRE